MRGRGIIVGGMILGLLLGCNNGLADELASEKRMGEIGRSAENVFYSFVDFIADTLGFKATKDKTKQDLGDYFSSKYSLKECVFNTNASAAIRSTSNYPLQ